MTVTTRLWLILALAPGAGGCWTTTSSAGSFVTDVGFAGEQLYIRECHIDYEVTEHLDLNLNGNNKDSTIAARDCSEIHYRLPPSIDGVPAAAPDPEDAAAPARPAPPRKTFFTPEQRRTCARPLAEWRMLPPAKRQQRLPELPAVCRKMLTPAEVAP